jgi:nucleotide-binding universal stress UspA family protein
MEKEKRMPKTRGTLVGLKTRDHAASLTELACRVADPDETLLLVHVIELPEITPLNAPIPDLDRQAEQILHVGADVARRHRRKVRTQVMRARSAGKALLEELKDRKVALAVLGSHHGRSLQEYLLGTTHQYLAQRAPCRLLLDIPPRK